MIYAYDKNMVDSAQSLLGSMLDYSVYGLKYSVSDFYQLFLDSNYARGIEKGNSKIIMGTSGTELCYDILGSMELDKNNIEEFENHAIAGRSREYWTGWALAYYQWNTSFSFDEINSVSKVDDIIRMYPKYHEMDINHFVDKMNELYKEKYPDTRLKTMRKTVGISQRDLSEMTGIPLKTIQQYEQRQKDINHAKVDYLIKLSRAMSCDIELLIEKV